MAAFYNWWWNRTEIRLPRLASSFSDCCSVAVQSQLTVQLIVQLTV